MISTEQYDAIQARLAMLEQWIASSPAVHRSKNGACSYPSDAMPLACRVSNEERSSVEVYRFYHDKPTRYGAYVGKDHRITTWTGETLATITRRRHTWRSNFGDTRQTLYSEGINGLLYQATYYKSAGSYCHMHAIKKG